MHKVFNWTFGSFFRTLGRFAFYILIGYILSCLINFKEIKLPSLWDVYAETIVPNYIEINDSQFSGYSYIGNSTNNSNVSLNVYISEVIDKIDIPYLIVDLCVPSEPYVDRSHSVGNACSNSCFSNLVQKQKISGSCKTNGQTGQIWRVNTAIVKWGLGTQIATLDDTFYVSIPKTGNNYISVYGVYLSYDSNYNETIDYTQNFNNVINNQNQNTQDIINNQEQNTQDIIDNQNANSQAQIDSQKVCTSKTLTYNDILTTNTYLTNGVEAYSNEYGITDYLEVSRIQVRNLVGYSPSVCFYTEDKTLISCKPYNQLSENQYITIPNNTKYTRFSIRNDNKPQFEVNLCQNGNQAMTDTLTDDSAPNISGLTNSAGWLPAGPVDSILNLPLSFLNNLNTNLSKSCTPVTLTLPYVNRDLQLPCLNSIYAQINGLPTWINSVGIIASAFILFGYLINLYKYIDDTLTFRENNYIDNWSGV